MDSFDNLLQRHRDFWELIPVNRPLIEKQLTKTWTKRAYPLAGGAEVVEPTRLRPTDADIERMVGFRSNAGELFLGDLINSVGVIYPQAWMGALIGCPIYASAHGCVSKPAGKDVETALADTSVESAFESEWIGVMDQLLHRAIAMAGDRFPVQQFHLRGAVDMVAAYLGEGTLCTGLFDFPDDLRKLANLFAELYIAVAKRSLSMRPHWEGGRVSNWKVYAPGDLIDYQADATNLISPAMYETIFMSADEKVLESFPYSVIHLHTCGLHIVEPLLKIRCLKAIQVNLDRETGVWNKKQILDCCTKIQDASKSLIICGELSEQERVEFVERLKPEGLALQYWNPEND